MAESIKTSPLLVGRSNILRRHLTGAGLSIVAVEFSRRLAITISLGIGLFGLLLLLDLTNELPWDSRKAILFVITTFTGSSLLWTIIALVTQRKSDEELALLAERNHKKFDSRLISAVQFAKGKAAFPENAPLEMVQAMIKETETESQRFQFGKIVNPRKMARASLILLVVLASSGTGAFMNRDTLSVLLNRAFGSEEGIPRDTIIIEGPGNMRVGIGDTFPMDFLTKTKGVSALEGKLKIHYTESARESILSLARDETIEGKYSLTIEDVPESFTYSATINDARTDNFNVIAIQRPEVREITATQTYPEFTRQPVSEHVPGDFVFFPGSKVVLNIASTKSLTSGTIRFSGSEKEYSLNISEEDKTIGSTSILMPSEKLTGFTVFLTDEDKMNSSSNSVYKVTLLTDRAPEIRITYPKRAEELVTRKARLLLQYEATDRFGIASVNLRYIRGETKNGTVPVKIPTAAPKTINGKIDWDLGSLEPGLSEGDEIEYWLEAADQNTSGANLGTSDRLLFRVVTPEEKRADLLGRASDALGSIDEATTDQENLNQDLETIIRKTSSNSPNKD